MNGLASFRMVCRVVPLFLAFPLMCFSAESQFARTASAPAAAMDVALRGEQPETEPIELNPNADLEGETREADYTLASTPMRAELPTLEFVAEGAGGSAHAAKITAREGEAGALQRAIRIDKGEMLTFSADVRAEGVRSVEIVVVPRVRRPGGPGAVMPGDMGRSKKLTGSFDWTTLTFDHAFRGNFDDALLQIVVQGPGTVWIDNVRVQAHWPKKVEIPDKPAAPLLVLVLMHSETPEAYVRNRDFFRADAAKYEEMAKMLQRYGARLGLEPERELWLGARQFDPDFPRRMHERYGASFSVHTHGPQGRPTEQDVLDYVQLRKKEMEEMGAGPVTDLNGNFDDALLQIVVQGPGTVWIDNVRVQAHWPKKVAQHLLLCRARRPLHASQGRPAAAGVRPEPGFPRRSGTARDAGPRRSRPARPIRPRRLFDPGGRA
ncbi:MAG: hypothetical protein NTW86_06525 [Candidatus Sumerlaeota bacterium]|nr:hypothetical protein [Candidatus Sumerlaeota bacterium]